MVNMERISFTPILLIQAFQLTGKLLQILGKSTVERKIPNYTIFINRYSEIKDHIFGQEPTGLGTGHFTQVVWKETKELGVGCTKARDGKIYVVANYYPPGNYIGDFAVNVPPLGGGTTLEKVTEGLKVNKTIPNICLIIYFVFICRIQ